MQFGIQFLLMFLLYESATCRPCLFVIENRNFDNFSVPSFYMTRICFFLSREREVTLSLKNCTLPAFPDKAFSSLEYMDRFTLELCSGTSIELLAPDIPFYSPFVNLRFGSAIIEANDIASMAGWRWSVLSNLDPTSTEGLQFIATNSKLVYLRSDFGSVASGKVTLVRILKCGLRWLGESVFAPFRMLRVLELRDNEIENIERSHLPSSAPELRTIDLGRNKLTKIPKDLFTNFKLSTIFLDGNKIWITMEHLNVILTLQHFTLDLDLVWPCNCDMFPKLQKKFGKSFDTQLCFLTINKRPHENFQKFCQTEQAYTQ